MVQVSYPGVYVQEVPSGSRTITGVATSIALFIGMASRGPVNEPKLILSFSDYVRVFSDSTAAGEMTDQVRQFFLNGGQRAYVVRVAHGATGSTVALGAVVSLQSLGAGDDEASLRAAVDYDTDNPGVSFNLTLYREAYDSAGNASASETEVHRNLSLISGSPRFVETIVNRDSLLARATVSGVTQVDGTSRGGLIVADAAALDAAVNAAITGLDGRFQVSVSGIGTRTVTVAPAGGVAGIGSALAAQFGAAVTATASAFGGGVTLLLTATNADILVSSASTRDIAAPLGLGVANGGQEVGSASAQRPAVGGIVTPDDPSTLAQVSRAALAAAGATIVLTGAEGFTLELDDQPIEFPDGYPAGGTGPEMSKGTTSTAAGDDHLANLRENLQAIATAINRFTSKWQATVQGFQLVLEPLFGDSTTGTGASLDIAAGTLAGTGSAVATAFAGGGAGSVAEIIDYTDVFPTVDRNVDLFNLMVLPKSAGDTAVPSIRDQVWGAASAFCQQRRAFLLIDAPVGVADAPGIVAAAKKLRIGLKKDHAALYWPRVAINPDGTRRFVDPSGTIAGLMSRIDGTRGVWKAPAGIEAELLGTLGVEVAMSDAENGVVNPEAVNAIRVFPNGIISWGSRTMDGFDNSGNDDYKYVPVRRLALFIAESLQRGLKFAVFEPNDEPLWAQIRLAAGGFMNTQFRRGAFQGRTSREAYFVKVDSETTTQNDINLGIVNVVVGFAPLKPAEFVVVTLKQQAGQIQV